MEKIWFNKREYEQLDPVIKAHYQMKIIILLVCFIIPVYFAFGLHLYAASLVIFIGIIAGILEVIHQVNLFCKNKVKKLTGVCVKVMRQTKAENIEKKLLKTNVFFGKCTLYLMAEQKIYEVMVPQKKVFGEEATLNVWYMENTFMRANGVKVIHEPLLVSLVSLD